MCQYILHGQHTLLHTTIRVWVCVSTYCNRASSWPKPNPELQSLKNQHSYKVLINIVCGRTVGRYEIHEAIVGDTHKTCLCFETGYVYGRIGKVWSALITIFHTTQHKVVFLELTVLYSAPESLTSAKSLNSQLYQTAAGTNIFFCNLKIETPKSHI
jgi:hypothetical protein